jgi:beta-N-acetylhexosaminidase
VNGPPLGPVMLDVAGTALEPDERRLLAHPLVGGVILFARNYASPAQLKALTADIRAVREPQLLIAVDQEGGRVQRFRDGFTRVPPMGEIGAAHRNDPARGIALARAAGRVLAGELVSHGVDFSFTPVLDLDFGRSGVIGDRAFCGEPARAAELAAALVAGLDDGGVAAVGKHFPGHGWAEADSHHALPVDDREFAEIDAADLVPYRKLIPLGLAGIMPAHVVYPRVDPRPAGFSEFWLQRVLRGRLGFDGLIFSDDLSMEGASEAGGIVARADAAFAAGCDMVLVCNAPEEARRLLDGMGARALDPARADRMRAKRPLEAEVYRSAKGLLDSLGAS